MEIHMKSITVYQEGVENIELFDDEDGDVESFARTLTNVLKSSTVSIINVGNTALIVRPSKVISILIKDPSEEVIVTPKGAKSKKAPKSKNDQKVDIITDVDK